MIILFLLLLLSPPQSNTKVKVFHDFCFGKREMVKGEGNGGSSSTGVDRAPDHCSCTVTVRVE